MKAVTSNNYRARIDRVLAHLAAHLDADLSLAELARIAHFSPYHFHRMFRAMTGESVAAVVRRLRLETAGRALRERDGSVTDVALAAGYGSPEAFTRAFQQAFGAAPSDYRRAVVAPRYLPPLSLELTLDRATMRLSLEPFGSTDMDVAIEVCPDRSAACLRHVGPYDHAGPTYERVLRWAATAGLLERDAVVMGLSYDDPGAVAEDALRYDVCFGLTEPVALPVEFRLETVRGGRYAVHALRGPYNGIHDAFRRLFGKWLPTSGEEIDDRPCLELHMSRPTEVPESERLTKVCVPLRNKSPRSATELTPDARAVGPVPGVVTGSSEGARQIRRRLRQALETRR
jgi:AraC family transcriptional regulator